MPGFSFKRQLKVPIHQIVSADTHMRGELSFQGGLLIQGRVDGRLLPQGADCSVTVAENARLVTDGLEVGLLIVNGTVASSTLKAARVVLGATAKVTGDIHAQSIEIHTGAIFDGRVVSRGGQEAAATGDGQVRIGPEGTALTAGA